MPTSTITGNILDHYRSRNQIPDGPLPADDIASLHKDENDREKIMDSQVDTFFILGAGALYNHQPSRHAAIQCRDQIADEVSSHVGHIIWIDDARSIRMKDERLERAILDSIKHASAAGYIAARVWGCEEGPKPYEGWEGIGLEGEPLVFDDDEDAVRYFAESVKSGWIKLAGAWIGLAHQDENLNRAINVLRDEFGCEKLEVGYSAFVDLDREYMLMSN